HLFLAGNGEAILHRLARLRITGRGRDLDRRRAVGRDHRHRPAHAGIVAAIGIGAGGAEHGAADQGERRRQPAVVSPTRRVVVHLVFVRLERDVVVEIAFVGVAVVVRIVVAALVGIVLAVIGVLLAVIGIVPTALVGLVGVGIMRIVV